VKGGLGAVLIGYALAFAAAANDRSTALRGRLHPVRTSLGLATAVVGFGVYTLMHVVEPLQDSLDDQVGGRIFTWPTSCGTSSPIW